MSRTEKTIEERRKAIEEEIRRLAKEGYSEEQARVLLPRRLWRNVPLEAIESGDIEVVFHGDDLVDEGKVKRVELRLGQPVMLSSIKRWIDEGGLLRAFHWILALNKAAEPPKVEDELSKQIEEKLAELKAALIYLEEARKEYSG